MNFSVALCTYNGEPFLREQLDSIARQSLLPRELVVCDDRSSDDTLTILEDFRNQAPFAVHIHRNETNLGSTRNFEKAIGLCNEEIIVLSDQDDVWLPEKLARFAEAFQNHPEIGYAFSDGEVVDETLRPLGRRVWDSNQFQGQQRSQYEAGEQLLCFLRWQFVTGATMAFRARLKEFLFPFPKHEIWIHDGWIAVVGSTIGEPGLAIPEPLIQYRQHGRQQIGANLSDKGSGLWHDFTTLRKNRQDFIRTWTRTSAFFSHLRKHLQQLPGQNDPQTADSILTLEQFERHFQNRLKIFSGNLLQRLCLIPGELFSGRYGKFSNSWKSAVADLLL